MLKSGPRPLTEWKSSDSGALSGEFKNWSRAETGEFTIKVVDEITSHPYGSMLGFGTVILGPDYQDKRLAKAFEEHALRLCLINIVGAICRYALNFEKPEAIHFWCDEQPKFEGRIRQAWRSVVQGSWYPVHLDPPEFGRSHDEVPLQAADLLAYEIRKDLKNLIARPERPRNMSLHRLIKGHPHVGFYIDDEIIQERFKAKDENRPMPGPAILFAEGIEIGWDPPVSYIYDPRPPR